MQPKHPSEKYHISVLLDLSKSSELVLTNAVQLAKALEGVVEVFHVKPLADMEKTASFEKNSWDTGARIQKLIETVENEERMTISYKVEYGNVKHRVRDYLALQKPDIIVLGKRRVGFLGESITDFVINETDTHVLITGKDDKFHTFKDLNLGVFGNGLHTNGLEIIKDLKRSNEKPLRIFNIKGKEQISEQELSPMQKSVSYEFSEGANALDGLVSYVSRTNTQLLCVPKTRRKFFSFQTSAAEKLWRKVTVPVFIMK